MRQIVFIVMLLFSLSSQAFDPVGSGIFNLASNVSKASDLQCAGTTGMDASGNPQVTISDCVLRIAVMEGSTVMNFCYHFSSYDLLSSALGRSVSLYDVVNSTKSERWAWFPQWQQPPVDIDPRCVL